MADSNDLTCRELVELVTDYLDGALPAAELARFEAHLVDCDACRFYLGQMRLTIRTVGALSEERLAPAARTQLLQIFRDWKRQQPAP